jgi:hypothetical protein
MTPISPAELRAITGTPASAVAKALGIGLGTLALLEACPTGAWRLDQLRGYCRACGAALDLAAVDRTDGARHVLK